MIVESEALYTAYLLIFIVPFVRNDLVAEVFLQSPSLIQVGVSVFALEACANTLCMISLCRLL